MIGKQGVKWHFRVCRSGWVLHNAQAPAALIIRNPSAPSPVAAGHKGIGLSNTRARLRQLYGEQASLTIAPGERGGAAVSILIPFHIFQ